MKTHADLELLVKSAEKIEAEWKGKEMPEADVLKYNELLKEGAALSEKLNEQAAQAKTLERMRAAAALGREVPNPVLPAAGDTKADSEIVGYLTPGHAVVLSQHYSKAVKRDGTWDANAGQFTVELSGSMLGRGPQKGNLIALTANEIKTLNSAYEQIKSHPGFQQKDLPVFGELVIAPNRVDRFVQDSRPEVLTLRDILTVSPTSSPLIQYVAEVSYTSDAGVQSEGTTVATTGTKGEDDVEYELRDASIKTIATTIPVSEQQLADAPALISRINTRGVHGVRRKEEQLMGYGTGTGLEFAGFFDGTFGVTAATTSGTTLIDKIREAATEVMTSFYQPSFVWIHPDDWESIELTKGSDGHYVWAIVRDLLGPRIWSMRVVQGTGTRKAATTTTNVLIGDPMGAVIYDRQQTTVSVGWVDDQFAKNLRTIRFEERMTLVIDAPAAFRKIETAS